jgi:hypothetical protein
MADRIAAPPVPSESCRAWVADRFSVDVMVRRYVELYEQALRPLSLSNLADGSNVAALAGEAATE